MEVDCFFCTPAGLKKPGLGGQWAGLEIDIDIDQRRGG